MSNDLMILFNSFIILEIALAELYKFYKIFFLILFCCMEFCTVSFLKIYYIVPLCSLVNKFLAFKFLIVIYLMRWFSNKKFINIQLSKTARPPSKFWKTVRDKGRVTS